MAAHNYTWSNLLMGCGSTNGETGRSPSRSAMGACTGKQDRECVRFTSCGSSRVRDSDCSLPLRYDLPGQWDRFFQWLRSHVHVLPFNFFFFLDSFHHQSVRLFPQSLLLSL